MRILAWVMVVCIAVLAGQAEAQTLTASNVKIEWKVTNRFRLFKNAGDFQLHEDVWRQYLTHVDNAAGGPEAAQRLRDTSSVLGIEHMLNDRYIPFSRHLRSKYDPMGWASRQVSGLCWDEKSRTHAACGGVEDYVKPRAHEITMWLKPLDGSKLLGEYNCSWRLNDSDAFTAPCDANVTAMVPWPDGGTISVNVEGETPITTDIKVKDLLIVGMGDSFASGEGNPDLPVTFDDNRRYKNLYPRRARNNAGGSAQWLDEPCHRSLYGHQLRTALQVAIENPKIAVTFLGYACSGASVEEGILGPQTYVEYVGEGASGVRSLKGGSKDNQLYWLLRELCTEKPDWDDGQWVCPNNAYRRNVDYLLLSVGGNDIGFSNLVAWATLRDNTSSSLAKLFGATVSAKQFERNMKDTLPESYARLARAIARAVPLQTPDLGFDPSRVILTAYPDILEDENGKVCSAGEEGVDEDLYPANQSLDVFSSWLALTPSRIERAHQQLENLQNRMGALAQDQGWTFAGRAYGDKPFRGHGFCAQNQAYRDDPAEVLMIPCWGKASRETKTCETSWSGKVAGWRPYNPRSQSYPYALRQRWVRTFNDAYMVVNQKVLTKAGTIDEDASSAVFSETTGAMHPSAEGHAAMADAIMIDLRPVIAQSLPQDSQQ